MVCIYHSRDLDGWCSAAIVALRYQKLKDPTEPLTMIGWDYGQHIPEINPKETVVMVDISFPKQDMVDLNANRKLIWIDHHKSAIESLDGLYFEGLRDVKYSACELTWINFFTESAMPEFVRLLGRYDCFGHKNTDEEQTVLEFQYAARSFFKSWEDCLEMLEYETEEGSIDSIKTVPSLLKLGKGIYKYLQTEAEQEYQKKFTVYFGKHKFACVNKCRLNPINFGIDYHKEGYDGFACFWFENYKWYFSLYNDDGSVDCSEICSNLGGGGHKGASGFTTINLDSIINNPEPW